MTTTSDSHNSTRSTVNWITPNSEVFAFALPDASDAAKFAAPRISDHIAVIRKGWPVNFLIEDGGGYLEAHPVVNNYVIAEAEVLSIPLVFDKNWELTEHGKSQIQTMLWQTRLLIDTDYPQMSYGGICDACGGTSSRMSDGHIAAALGYYRPEVRMRKNEMANMYIFASEFSCHQTLLRMGGFVGLVHERYRPQDSLLARLDFQDTNLTLSSETKLSFGERAWFKSATVAPIYPVAMREEHLHELWGGLPEEISTVASEVICKAGACREGDLWVFPSRLILHQALVMAGYFSAQQHPEMAEAMVGELAHMVAKNAPWQEMAQSAAQCQTAGAA